SPINACPSPGQRFCGIPGVLPQARGCVVHWQWRGFFWIPAFSCASRLRFWFLARCTTEQVLVRLWLCATATLREQGRRVDGIGLRRVWVACGRAGTFGETSTANSGL